MPWLQTENLRETPEAHADLRRASAQQEVRYRELPGYPASRVVGERRFVRIAGRTPDDLVILLALVAALGSGQGDDDRIVPAVLRIIFCEQILSHLAHGGADLGGVFLPLLQLVESPEKPQLINLPSS